MRNRAYRRAQTRRVIARREAIVRNVYQCDPAETQIWVGHRLDKGKVHCSCQLCSVKTNPRRCKLNGGWKHSDKKDYYEVLMRRLFLWFPVDFPLFNWMWQACINHLLLPVTSPCMLSLQTCILVYRLAGIFYLILFAEVVA